MAEKADLPYPTVRDIEAGISNGREETKAALAKALGASISDLHITEDETAVPDFTAAISLLSKFQGLEPDLQKVVLALVHKDISYVSDVSDDFAKKFEPLLKAL